MSIIWLLLLGAINLFFAWRYAGLDIDPDFGMFNLAGQTGSWYGRDFVDCKSPLVHIWFWILGRIFGSVYYVRFAHYFITGVPGIIYAELTGNVWGGLAFIILVHSGFLMTFHGNVQDIPAGLILLSFAIGNPWISFTLLVLATLYEPKLIVCLIALVATGGYWWQSTAYLGGGLVLLLAIWYFKHNWFEWLVEANIKIPKAMNAKRKGQYGWMPPFTSQVLMYLGAWMALAIIQKPEPLYWLPVLLYFGLISISHVIRPVHLIVIIPWVAHAIGTNPLQVVALTSVDIVAAGFYIGDIWDRFYNGLRNMVKESKSIGEYLKDKEGTLWVNTIFTEIYVWAKKPIIYGMTWQAEISQVARDRKKKMFRRTVNDPPVWVVDQKGREPHFDSTGYELKAKSLYFQVYKLKEE